MSNQHVMFGEKDGLIWRVLFGALAIFLFYCLYTSWQLADGVGGAMFSNMLVAMSADPLVAFGLWDLGALMALVSLWVYRDCQQRHLGFWYLWVPAFYIFGTLGVLAYFMYAAGKPIQPAPA